MAVGDPYPGNLREPPRSPHNHPGSVRDAGAPPDHSQAPPVLPLTTHKPWGPPAQAMGQLGGCWTPLPNWGWGESSGQVASSSLLVSPVPLLGLQPPSQKD